jgi:HSP20 family molecular chaperone IbpA
MDSKQELQVQQKRELEKKEERTIPARIFLPTADIYETQDAISVVLEMPGVEKSNVDVRVEDGVLKVDGDWISPNTKTATPLHGVQRRPLLEELSAIEQD